LHEDREIVLTCTGEQRYRITDRDDVQHVLAQLAALSVSLPVPEDLPG
jgi:hypothetical protein